MKDQGKTREQLLAELEEQRRRNDRLEQSLVHDSEQYAYAELALLETEKRFRDVVENLEEGIGIVDESERFVFANSSAERIFGVGAGELIGLPLTDFVDDETAKFFEIETERRRSGVTSRYDIRVVTRDGSRRDLSVTVSPHLDEDGEFLGTLGTFSDITERKRVERELQQARDFLETALAQSPSGVIIADAPDGTIRLANAAAYGLRGGSKELLTGIDVSKHSVNWQTYRLDGTPHPPDELPLSKAVLRGETVTGDEVIIRDEAGNDHWVLANAAPILDPEGNTTAGIVIFTDVTDRKRAEEDKARLEEQLRRAQKLETVGTLAGGIAHDFNNVLAPILGYTDMALQGLDSGDPLAKDLQHVLDAAHRAKDLVQQILLFSKQAEQERNPIGLQAVVEEAIRLLRPTIPTTIDIRKIIDQECDKVQADATQLHQVIVNLCTNAWHAMREDGGTLTIELKQTTVSGETARLHRNLVEAEYACLSVIDTGPGMDERIVERVFEPFFTTKAVDEGTGLGLSVVHGIVQSHDGEILVESEPGRGTAFHVYLPTITADTDVKIDDSGEAAAGSESILVVDDEPAIAELVRTMLASRGYEVEAYHSSSEALEAFRLKPQEYDLLVSDLTMPNMTGLALAGSVQKEHRDFPVIIMTGFGDSVTTDNWEQHGVRKVIKKPVLMRDLVAAVRNVLDG